jgi:DNA-binding protein H-NS
MPVKANQMTNLLDIQNQIGKLQRQAEEIKRKDFEKTVQDIVAKIQAFGITEKDLFPGRGGKPKMKGVKVRRPTVKSSSSAGIKVAPRFRGPNGETWSGRGLTPKWLAALESEGKSRDDFAIKP